MISISVMILAWDILYTLGKGERNLFFCVVCVLILIVNPILLEVSYSTLDRLAFSKDESQLTLFLGSN